MKPSIFLKIANWIAAKLEPKPYLLFVSPANIAYLNNTFYVLAAFNPSINCWYAVNVLTLNQIVIRESKFWSWLNMKAPMLSSKLMSNFNFGYPTGIYVQLPIYIRPHETLQAVSVQMPNVALTMELVAANMTEVINTLNNNNKPAQANANPPMGAFNLDNLDIPKVIN